MTRSRTIEAINEKIRQGNVVVMTAEEVIGLVREQGPESAFDQVDVVTTATFGPMCSTGAFLNFGHSDPPIRLEKITLNNVPASGGLAAVDTYIGATDVSESAPESYGGAHVICDLVEGKKVTLKGSAKGTDCYPGKSVSREVSLEDLNEAFMFNPRNAYQNYAAAINLSSRPIHTYMGTLLPDGSNITYSTTGQLSPLLNDPYLKTIGIGTRIFLAGAQGYVAFNGTQFKTDVERDDNGIPKTPAATLSVIGNLKKMDREFLSPVVFKGYGVSMNVGIGIPIPVLNPGVLSDCGISDEAIKTNVIDYSVPARSKPVIATVTYAELRSGEVSVGDRKVKTAPLSSLRKARKIAQILKEQIQQGEFFLSQPVEYFTLDHRVKPMAKGGEDA